jgi:hypothetical protein
VYKRQFLFIFFYTSRFLNENYLGYILAFLALGTLASEVTSSEAERSRGNL